MRRILCSVLALLLIVLSLSSVAQAAADGSSIMKETLISKWNSLRSRTLYLESKLGSSNDAAKEQELRESIDKLKHDLSIREQVLEGIGVKIPSSSAQSFKLMELKKFIEENRKSVESEMKDIDAKLADPTLPEVEFRQLELKKLELDLSVEKATLNWLKENKEIPSSKDEL